MLTVCGLVVITSSSKGEGIMGENAVEKFYNENVESEWNRLEVHKMEFAVTMKAMLEYMPAGASVLDIGGGPGRYSIELLKRGYDVTLMDLSEENVKFAEQNAKEAGLSLKCLCGNAVEGAPFPNETFDVVLLMGPLYHLIDENERHEAIRQALRVLKPGGLLYASFITRYAFLVDMLKYDPGEIVHREEYIEQLLNDGIHKPTASGGFTEAYFIHPIDIDPLLQEFGLEEIMITAPDGLIMSAEQRVNQLPEEAFHKWVELCYRLGTDSTIWGTSEHMLYVGRKANS